MSGLNFYYRFKILIIAALIIILQSACHPLMPDGQISLMTRDTNYNRKSLEINPETIATSFTYKAIKEGIFELSVTQPDSSTISMKIDFSIIPVRDRLLVVGKKNGDFVYSVLLSNHGKLHDYNFTLNKDDRITPETHKINSMKNVEERRRQGDKAPHVIELFALIYPEYTKLPPHSPGDTVAIVRAEDGNIWGEFRYRGTTNYKNKRAFVLDLVRTVEDSKKHEYLFGFNIIDPSTNLPYHLVFDKDTKVIGTMLSLKE